MRIASTPSRTSLDRQVGDVRREAVPATTAQAAGQPRPDTEHLPCSPQDELPEPAPQGPGPLDRSLDGQMQKARIANLLLPPFQALPMKVYAQFKALKPPDAGIQQPKADAVTRLNDMLTAAKKAAESGTEEGRLAVDKVLKEAVKVYGIGQDGVTGLEFDPKLSDQGGTIGPHPRTFIVIGRSALDSAPEMASTILHESSHVQRNKELADNGIDRAKFGFKAEGIYSALIEIEGYSLEINNAKKLGTSPAYVKGAEQLKERYLRELETVGGKDWRALAEKGQFKQVQEKFRQEVLKAKP
ncbi:MAG: hypothetical protein ACKV22_00465 [Bryobacteraceae bacterium]